MYVVCMYVCKLNVCLFYLAGKFFGCSSGVSITEKTVSGINFFLCLSLQGSSSVSQYPGTICDPLGIKQSYSEGEKTAFW